MLLDSNLIIYASQPQHGALRRFIAREVPYVSAVSKVETLGYHELGEDEKRFLEEFFDAAEVLPVSGSAITVAIRLRQKRRMSLGDALIAGTALSHGVPLATHNEEDFAWIEELEVVDPLANES
jgi:predicted nucleic acid-binding protein